MKERFSLTIEATNGDSRPAAIRLRGLLKVALRAFGLRCIEVSEMKDEPKMIENRPSGSAPVIQCNANDPYRSPVLPKHATGDPHRTTPPAPPGFIEGKDVSSDANGQPGKARKVAKPPVKQTSKRRK